VSIRRRRALVPFVLLAPGLLWLAIFYLVPIVNQAGCR